MVKLSVQSWLLLLFLTIVWGSSFILMKTGLLVFSPYQMASLRIFAAALSLLPIAIYHIRKLPWTDLRYILLFGFFNAGIPAFLFAISQQHINSSTAGILNSLTPLFTLLMGAFFFKVSFNVFKFSGVVIGFFGAVLLIYYRDKAFSLAGQSEYTFYVLLIVLATAFYGMAGNILKTHLHHIKGYIIASIAYAMFGLPLGIYLFSTDFVHKLATGGDQALESFFAILILGIIGSAFAIILYHKLIQQSNALFASFVTYLIPFVAIIWGWADGEPVTAITFLSLAIILGGIFISGWQPAKNVARTQ